MKIVDLKRHKIIKMGLQWPYTNATPNSAKILPLLERNEALVSWMEPNDGSINDQFPAIKFSDDCYYMLSLRQMKVSRDWLVFNAQFLTICVPLLSQSPSGNTYASGAILSTGAVKSVSTVCICTDATHRETIPYFGERLKIPLVLLQEKIRTQQRFSVRRLMF
jgi:hypothetical protein